MTVVCGHVCLRQLLTYWSPPNCCSWKAVLFPCSARMSAHVWFCGLYDGQHEMTSTWEGVCCGVEQGKRTIMRAESCKNFHMKYVWPTMG